jgi:hypothetical protein
MLHLDEATPVILPRISAEFRCVDANLFPALASALGYAASDDFFQRLQSGRQCYTAWVGERLAAYGWVSFDTEFIGELNLRIRLLPGEAYIWDCVTLPAFRQKHLYSALLVYMLEELRSRQWCRVWIGADLDNTISQKGIARAGFHHVADLVVARVLALRQVWVQGQPGAPDHIVTEARRAFLDDRDKVWLKASSMLSRI